MATIVGKSDKLNLVSRGKLSSDELQDKLNRKAHRFTDRRKKSNKYACRNFDSNHF